MLNHCMTILHKNFVIRTINKSSNRTTFQKPFMKLYVDEIIVSISNNSINYVLDNSTITMKKLNSQLLYEVEQQDKIPLSRR